MCLNPAFPPSLFLVEGQFVFNFHHHIHLILHTDSYLCLRYLSLQQGYPQKGPSCSDLCAWDQTHLGTAQGSTVNTNLQHALGQTSGGSNLLPCCPSHRFPPPPPVPLNQPEGTWRGWRGEGQWGVLLLCLPSVSPMLWMMSTCLVRAFRFGWGWADTGHGAGKEE